MRPLQPETLNDDLAAIVRGLSFFMFTLLLFATAVFGGEREDVRIRAGLDLFPSLLAADMEIENKKSRDGTLLLVLIYTTDREKAEELAGYLKRVDRIRELPIRVEISDDPSLEGFKDRSPAGIFLTQPVGYALDEILKFARYKKIIVFSPFEGDVERGVPGGIHISDRLLPYLNVTALRSSDVQIKSFFLRVSMQYAE